MRILQVVGSLRVGGLETVAMNCMRYADKENCQFDFLVFGNDRGEYEKEADEAGCGIIRIAAPGKNYARYYSDLCKVMNSHGPYDIVHSHVFFNSGIVLLAAKRCGVPVRIAHAHSVKRQSDSGIQKQVFQSLMRALLIRNATKFCACSEQAGEFVFTKNAFHNKGMVLPNVIDPNLFAYSQTKRKRIRDEFKIREASTVVGQVGHLTAAKNQKFLIDFFAEYKKLHPDSVLLLVGDGERKEQLQQQIAELGLQNDVYLTGTRSDIGDLLSAMDVYVCTSTNEGFGITLLEAAANGLRIVVKKGVLVAELKSVLSYKDVDDFDVSKWADAVYETVIQGRADASSIRKTPYTIESMRRYIDEIYGA